MSEKHHVKNHAYYAQLVIKGLKYHDQFIDKLYYQYFGKYNRIVWLILAVTIALDIVSKEAWYNIILHNLLLLICGWLLANFLSHRAVIGNADFITYIDENNGDIIATVDKPYIVTRDKSKKKAEENDQEKS